MKKFKLQLTALVFSLISAPALAATAPLQPQALGTFGFWHAFQVAENNQPICYMSLSGPPPRAPATTASNGKKTPSRPSLRGNVTLMITHRPSEGSKDVVSYAAGTKFKPASEAKIHIGEKDFSLFTQNDTAWSRDGATDHALAQAIRRGSSMIMYGESAKGEALADSVNLKGADQAYAAISKACSVPVEEIKPEKPAAKAPTAAKKH